MADLTQERLKKRLRYEPDTGNFYWLLAGRGRKQTAKPAGTKSFYGYIIIGVDGNLYKAHRLAMLYVTGNLPPDEVDHVNGIRDDNRFDNLRLCSRGENMKNMSRHGDNSSGFKGVYTATGGKTWFSQILTDGKLKYLGSFKDKESAVQAYDAAACELHGEFAKLNEVA